jgi:hypothetical protein
MWSGFKCSRLEITNHPRLSLKTKGKIRLANFFFCKAIVDFKSGRSLVQRVTSIETLRSLKKVSMIVWDKTKIMKRDPYIKKAVKFTTSYIIHIYVTNLPSHVRFEELSKDKTKLNEIFFLKPVGFKQPDSFKTS